MINMEQTRGLEPVHAGGDETSGRRWSHWLVVFLRVMAVLSLGKGLYHWAIVCGIISPLGSGFEADPTSYQILTVYFAVIDLVAGVGLWLAAAWGAVIWLTSVISMMAAETLFPDVYGGNLLVVGAEVILLAAYLVMALLAAREQPR
ncbi:MAG TPA: DUF6163 family protein [Xanthobacteraceae bacterium]|jgi:phage shock protein PspC (stress-responsive transcriptional regulator)